MPLCRHTADELTGPAGRGGDREDASPRGLLFPKEIRQLVLLSDARSLCQPYREAGSRRDAGRGCSQWVSRGIAPSGGICDKFCHRIGHRHVVLQGDPKFKKMIIFQYCTSVNLMQEFQLGELQPFEEIYRRSAPRGFFRQE